MKQNTLPSVVTTSANVDMTYMIETTAFLRHSCPIIFEDSIILKSAASWDFCGRRGRKGQCSLAFFPSKQEGFFWGGGCLLFRIGSVVYGNLLDSTDYMCLWIFVFFALSPWKHLF